jgi:hypothetical protein
MYCRRRSLVDFGVQNGMPALLFYPLYFFTLIALLLIATVIAAAVAIVLVKLIPAVVFKVAFWPFFIIVLLLLVWLALILPLRDYCILYEKGFSSRVSWTRCRVAFADLRELRLGKDPQGIEKMLTPIMMPDVQKVTPVEMSDYHPQERQTDLSRKLSESV